MPAKSSWLLKIPEIVETLSAMKSPVVDRGTFERLFGVRRRRAVELVQRFGGYRAGNTHLVDRVELVRRLQKLNADPEVAYEHRRKQKLSDDLEQARRHARAAAVVIQVAPATQKTEWALPSGVQFSGNCLIVEFSGVEELLRRLYGLAQAAAADFDLFSTVAGQPPSPR